MKNCISIISQFEYEKDVKSLINKLLYSVSDGYLNLSSKQAIEEASNYIQRFDYELQKIKKYSALPDCNMFVAQEKSKFINSIKEHSKKQLVIWANEVFEQYVDNLILELSINKNKLPDIKQKLKTLLDWYIKYNNFDVDKSRKKQDELVDRLNKALNSSDDDFIPVIVEDKTNEDDFIFLWELILKDRDSFLSFDFSDAGIKLNKNDVLFFVEVKNKLISSKNTLILDDIFLINSAIEILKLSQNEQKYLFIKQIISDFSINNQNKDEINDENKIKLIKRRMSLFQDKAQLSKEYFKKMIIS